MSKFSDAFTRNPLAWILAALLAFSVFSHYRTGSEFEQACVHAQAMFQRKSIESIYSDADARKLYKLCEQQLVDSASGDDF